MNLPRGIFFEKKRNRFRVRLYKKGVVIHRSYHHSLKEALVIYNQVAPLARKYTPPTITPRPPTLQNLFSSLLPCQRPMLLPL